MFDKANLASVRRANESPANQAALRFLPPDWIDRSIPHVLSLAMWGLQEHDLAFPVTGGRRPEADALEQRVMGLVRSSAEEVEAFLPVDSDFLESRSTPIEAAAAILEAAYGRLSDPEGYR